MNRAMPLPRRDHDDGPEAARRRTSPGYGFTWDDNDESRRQHLAGHGPGHWRLSTVRAHRKALCHNRNLSFRVHINSKRASPGRRSDFHRRGGVICSRFMPPRHGTAVNSDRTEGIAGQTQGRPGTDVVISRGRSFFPTMTAGIWRDPGPADLRPPFPGNRESRRRRDIHLRGDGCQRERRDHGLNEVVTLTYAAMRFNGGYITAARTAEPPALSGEPLAETRVSTSSYSGLRVVPLLNGGSRRSNLTWFPATSRTSPDRDHFWVETGTWIQHPQRRPFIYSRALFRGTMSSACSNVRGSDDDAERKRLRPGGVPPFMIIMAWESWPSPFDRQLKISSRVVARRGHELAERASHVQSTFRREEGIDGLGPGVLSATDAASR